MKIKILQVFYDENGLPFKDKERVIHYPIAQGTFMGSSNTTQIRFYYDRMLEEGETTFVAVSKLPNGKIGSKILESHFDSELNENYALLDLSNYYTQYKGDLFISLQGYEGGVRVEENENGIYQIYGTPTIQATGSIRLSINYATQFVGSGETENVTLQRVLAELATKLGIRQETLHVEELPEVGNPNVWYVVNDDTNDPSKANIYIWNAKTQSYVWVGDNTLNLGDYYTKEEGQEFENEIDERVSSVENELSSVASGSPKGVYATLSDLESAYPTGTAGIYVVSADGHWYYWNGSAWTDGGVYQAVKLANDGDFKIEKSYILNDMLNKKNLILSNDETKLIDKYVTPSGVIGNATGYCVYQFDVSGHNRIYCYMNNPVGVHYLYAFYEDDGTFISFVERSITISGGYIDIPNDAKYIKISFQYANIETFAMFFDEDIFYKLRYNFADKNDMIKYLNEKKINLVVPSTCIDNNYVNMNNGALTSSSGWSTTDYIQVVPGIRIYFDKGSSGSQVAFYSKDYVFISGALTNVKNSVVVPDNAMFMRWCFQTSTKSSAEVYFDTSLSSIRENIVKEVFPLIQGNTYNIIDQNDWEDGYYVRYNNGTLGADANYSSTGYIEVVPNVVYRFLNGAGGSQVAFYNESLQYISGAITGATGEAKTPDNARYLRWCCNVSGKASAIVSVSPSPADTYEITTTIGLLQGIMNAYLLGYKKVLVKEGTYNLIDEYKAKYGATYFDDYADNYNGNANGLYDHGVYLENIEIKFELNSKVVCDYEGDNSNVKQYFSAFAVGVNTIIDGLVLHARELRYGLHMDYNGSGTRETYIHIKNCDFDFIKGTNNFQSLGCGLGIHSFWTIENCIFRTTEGVSGIAVRIHNNASANSLSKIIVKDNYIIGDGYFKFAYYGASTKITDILVSNNSWITPASVGPETQDSSSANINFNMIAWNNETRS